MSDCLQLTELMKLNYKQQKIIFEEVFNIVFDNIEHGCFIRTQKSLAMMFLSKFKLPGFQGVTDRISVREFLGKPVWEIFPARHFNIS